MNTKQPIDFFGIIGGLIVIGLVIIGILFLLSPQTVRAEQSIGVEGQAGPSLNGFKVSYQNHWDNKWFREGNWFVTGYWDVSVQQWKTDATEDNTIVGVGLVPMFRFQQWKTNPWYVDAGVGAQVFNHRTVGERGTGSLANFTEQFGVGKLFGHKDQYDVSIRYQHTSNAGFAEPNRGYDVIGLRLAVKF